MVITANAKTKKRKDWDRRQSAPGLLDVPGLVTSGPMENYSFDTVQLRNIGGATPDRLFDVQFGMPGRAAMMLRSPSWRPAVLASIFS